VSGPRPPSRPGRARIHLLGCLLAAGAGCDDGAAAADALPPFSFFVTSLESMRELSGSEDGFGGDLRFGETGPGAGLRGADRICSTIAERSMPGSSVKQWRAFLSVTADEDGSRVNAIDRVGEGPWYDRVGRLVAPTRGDLAEERPQNGDPAIRNDLPNEFGVPNKQPDPAGPLLDNHHVLTGSDKQGLLYASSATCLDWTSATATAEGGTPRIGMSWPLDINHMGRGGAGERTPCTRDGDCTAPETCCDLNAQGLGRTCADTATCELLGAPDAALPGGGGGGDRYSWISAWSAPDCAPGVALDFETGPEDGSVGVGTAGGYGGIYCFALTP